MCLLIFIFIIFQAKVVIAEQTEKDIDETRSQYIPVAVRTQILFFCTYDLVRACLLEICFAKNYKHRPKCSRCTEIRKNREQILLALCTQGLEGWSWSRIPAPFPRQSRIPHPASRTSAITIPAKIRANPASRVTDPTDDWNPESKFHWEKLEFSVITDVQAVTEPTFFIYLRYWTSVITWW